MKTLALALSLFLSFFFFFKPTKRKEGDQLGDLSSVSIGSGGNLFPFSYSVGIEGEEKPEANPCQNPSLPLFFDLPCRP
jgi:hypothetical protein